MNKTKVYVSKYYFTYFSQISCKCWQLLLKTHGSYKNHLRKTLKFFTDHVNFTLLNAICIVQGKHSMPTTLKGASLCKYHQHCILIKNKTADLHKQVCGSIFHFSLFYCAVPSCVFISIRGSYPTGGSAASHCCLRSLAANRCESNHI